MFLGCHLTISKGYTHAVKEAISIGATTFQFFTRNPRGGSAKALDPKDLEQARKMREDHGFGPICAHAPYTINLAAVSEDTWDFAKRTMKEDLGRMAEAGIPYIVVHPGSHTGAGSEQGVARIAAALNEIFASDPDGDVMILLEGMSGSGSEVGGTFEELGAIIAGVEANHRLGVCLDTCHLYGAGYDIRQNLEGVLEQFDSLVGLDRLRAFHFNDSLMALASHRDRHAKLGEGYIGLAALARIICHPRLSHLPFNLETPQADVAGYGREVAFLKGAIAGQDLKEAAEEAGLFTDGGPHVEGFLQHFPPAEKKKKMKKE